MLPSATGSDRGRSGCHAGLTSVGLYCVVGMFMVVEKTCSTTAGIWRKAWEQEVLLQHVFLWLLLLPCLQTELKFGFVCRAKLSSASKAKAL